ncbi:MAG: hypothetical protein ABH818_01540 [Patescibacteria group bacterium]
MVAGSSTFESSAINLTTANQMDSVALHTDIYSGATLSLQTRSAATSVALLAAAWSTAQSL